MSDNTFDEDMISKSSRRVSAGTSNNRPTFKNDFLNFVDNSQDLKDKNGNAIAVDKSAESL